MHYNPILSFILCFKLFQLQPSGDPFGWLWCFFMSSSLIFQHHKIFQVYLLFSSPSSGINSFSNESNTFYWKIVFRNSDRGARVPIVTGVSLILGSLSGESYEIYAYIQTHTYTSIIFISVDKYIFLPIQISICRNIYVQIYPYINK